MMVMVALARGIVALLAVVVMVMVLVVVVVMLVMMLMLVVVIILVVLSAPTVREKLEALKKRHRTEEKKEAGTHAE